MKAFPLRMQYAPVGSSSIVLAGDGAHHSSVGRQGPNLGFGDVQELAQVLAEVELKDLHALSRDWVYVRTRKLKPSL